VEDDAVAQNLLSSIIAKRYPRLKLFVSDNGAAGLKLYREQRPDIVLADLNMPVMDGIEMARAIKTLDAEATIIAVTAHNNPKYLQNAIEIGIRHYVLKPISHDHLFAVIDSTIEELNLKRLVSEQDRQLRRREQQLARAQKITHLGSWEWDVTNGKMSWSDELYRIFGLEPAALPPSYPGFLRRVHPEDRQKVKWVVKNALRKRQSIISHYCRIVRPDNSIRIVHGQGEVIVDDSGRRMSVLGTAHDVTERRKMEEERARLAMIVESSNDAIFSVSLDHVITSWNRGAENIFGYSASEIIGRPIFTIFPADRYSERFEIMQTIMNGEQVRHFETTRLRKDGRQIYVSITTSPLLNRKME